MASTVELGFVKESSKAHRLQSCYFPSKIGGKPAWLELASLPRSELIQCPKCKQPMVHLIQVYAPLDGKEACFHRTLFVFLCKNSQCHSKEEAGAFKVFRSQLPRANGFYSFEPPSDDESCSGERPHSCTYTIMCTSTHFDLFVCLFVRCVLFICYFVAVVVEVEVVVAFVLLQRQRAGVVVKYSETLSRYCGKAQRK